VSLFGPIALIAIGLFFLFNRFNLLTDLYWLDVLRLWPLLLVFLGLNVLALQAPRPYTSLFSGLISLAAVLVFGYVLLNGLAGTPFSSRLAVGGLKRSSLARLMWKRPFTISPSARPALICTRWKTAAT
jgi:hypothetical protein